MRIGRGLAVLAALVHGACAGGGPAPSDPAAPPAPTGYQGALVVTPDPVAFEPTRIGCARTRPLQLANVRQEGAIAVVGIESSSRILRPVAPLPLEIPAGGRRTVDLHFVPEAPGDARGEIGFATGEPGGESLRLAVTGAGVERPAQAGARAAARPLDLVVALDVSTTMTGAAGVRGAVAAAFDQAAASGVDLRLGLVTFVNDVRVHGAGFLGREALLAELDGELDPDTGAPDPDGPRQLLNFDFEENVLDALHAAATRFPFRPEARRSVVLLTDATFLEPPAAFSDGIPVRWSLGRVARALGEGGVRLVAVTPAASARGIASSRAEEPSLVARTGGSWFDLEDVRRGAPPLDALVQDLVTGHDCD